MASIPDIGQLQSALDTSMGMGSLGQDQGARPVGAAGLSNGQEVQDSTIAAMVDAIQKQRAEAQKIAKGVGPAPTMPGGQGGALAAALAGILAGAGGAGGQGGAIAMGTAEAVYKSEQEAKYARSLEEYNAAKEGGAAALKTFEEMRKGALMLLQSQPDIMKSEMGPVISELALGGIGMPNMLTLGSKNGLTPGQSKRVEMVEWMMKSGMVKDPAEQERLAQVKADILGIGDLVKGGSQTRWVDPAVGGLSTEAILEHAVNSSWLLGKKERGEKIEWEQVIWRMPNIPKTVSDQKASLAAEWAQTASRAGVSMWEGFNLMEEDKKVLLNDWFGSMATQGVLDPKTVFQAGMRAIMETGDMAVMDSGDLSDPTPIIEMISTQLNQGVAAVTAKRVDTVNALVANRIKEIYAANPTTDEPTKIKQRAEARKQVIAELKASKTGRVWHQLDEDAQLRVEHPFEWQAQQKKKAAESNTNTAPPRRPGGRR